MTAREWKNTSAVCKDGGSGSITSVNDGGTETVSALDVFCRLAGTELPEPQTLARSIRLRELRAGEVLFRVGEPNGFVFIVLRGVVKLVYETPAGDAWVKGFVGPGLCFASLTALAPHGLTSCAAYAEFDTEIAQLPHDDLQALADRHLPWQRAIANAYKLYGQRKERREMELLTLSPEERYLAFLQEHPTLAAQLRQRDIASYVRITPVALSRIKARLARQAP